MPDADDLTLFAGNSNRPLARQLASIMRVSLGRAIVDRFSDGEAHVEIGENVRGRHVFVVQSTSAPPDAHLMELLIMSDALRRASCSSITAVLPYFGYARQDRRVYSNRVPISAKVVANALESVGVARILTIDLHSEQIQGFFNGPVDNIYASPALVADMWRRGHPNPIVVSPDVGGVVRARAIAKQLDDSDLAIIDKRRQRANESEVMNIIGDVAGKSCLIVDDMVDTAGTLCNAAIALKKAGAARVLAYATHPVLSGPALDRIAASALDEVVVTDTICLSEAAQACAKIRQVSIADLLAESMLRSALGQSVSSLFME